jgi:hypothetical protein
MENTKLTKDKVREYITKHLNILSEYDLDQLFIRSFLTMFKAEYGIYMYSGGQVVGGKMTLPNVNYQTLEATYNELVERLAQRGATIADLKEYQKVYHIFEDYLRPTADGYSIGKDVHVTNLVVFLQYLITGKVEDDLTAAHEYMKANGLMYDTLKYKFTVGNITVQRWVNGKFEMTGLTDEQKDKIAKLYKTYRALL